MNQAAIRILVLTFMICLSAVAAAKDRHHRRAPTVLSLRAPTSSAVRPPPTAPLLLNGQLVILRGRTAEQQTANSPLAAASTAVRAVRRGLIGGALRMDSEDKLWRRNLYWSAGAVPLSAMPSNFSLVPYNCHVADRLPGDPATVYRFVLLSLRF